jgi:hypothetical protein
MRPNLATDERGKNPDFKSVLSVAHLFGNSTAGTDEPPPVLFLYPLRECRALMLLRLMMMSVMFTLCGLCAAVFTEPAITQIEKVGCLVHQPQFT